MGVVPNRNLIFQSMCPTETNQTSPGNSCTLNFSQPPASLSFVDITVLLGLRVAILLRFLFLDLMHSTLIPFLFFFF